MNMGRVVLRRASVLVGGAALALAGERSAAAEESVATNVIEFVTHNRNNKGVVRCGLFKEKGWLKTTEKAAIVRINSKNVARCVFKEMPAGEYGISAFHDEDENGKLNTNFVGYPLEEYCATNNARNTFSAPSWEDAKFKYKGGTVKLKAVMK